MATPKKRGAWGELRALWATTLFGWATRADITATLDLSRSLAAMAAEGKAHSTVTAADGSKHHMVTWHSPPPMTRAQRADVGRERFYEDADGVLTPASTNPDDIAATRAEEHRRNTNS